MSRKLIVEIVGDATSLERAFKKSEKSASRFQRSMDTTSRKTKRSFGGMGKGLVGLGAGVGITAILKDSVAAASDLEQQVGKTSVVFGDSAKEVEAWSKTVDTAFGLSQREALTTASNFGALFAPIGLTGEAAAKQSIKLTQLGADLASFYNTDVQSALDAVRSGLVGEAEPLRKYGVLLSETRVQQEALRQTGKKHAADLTVQEKALARIAIIYRDSKTAQGDFARTSGTAANQAKIMQANIENLKAELAAGLIPALADAAHAFNVFFDAMSDDNLKKHHVGFLGKGLWENFQDLREKAPGFLQGPDVFRKKTKLGFDPISGVAKMLAGALQMPGAGADPKKKAAGLTKAQLADRRARIRQANEAFRQMQRDRAEFNVEKTGATKTLSDDLAALHKYNALLTKQMKGGHKTLELEREQFGVQMQIADVLRQQAEAIKEQKAAKKKMGVDVTRFQKTARGQFVLAGAAGGGRGVMIQGGVHLHGIQNVGQLENELARRSKQRARQRRVR